MFVDRVAIFVQGGAGGDGCLSFRREEMRREAAPTAATAGTVAA